MLRLPLLKRFPALRTWPRTIDLFILGAVVAGIYGLMNVVSVSMSPLVPEAQISPSPRALPAYAAYSVFRIAAAYLLSLAFTLVYGYVAAYRPKAERVMIPLLDILQSIPVLSFLPGVMLVLVGLFPHTQLGLELGAVLLIFTGQAWNMTFSFYSSLKSIPRDLRYAAQVSGFSWWQRFTELELPYAAIGLIWNSMMSVAGGWFFLMACEMFVLGRHDFRLPGLGSYLQTAASSGDTKAIVWGLVAMIGVIVALDWLAWKPLTSWAEKFKFEEVEGAGGKAPQSLMMLRRSRIVLELRRRVMAPLQEWLIHFFARRKSIQPIGRREKRYLSIGTAILIIGATLALYLLIRAGILLSKLSGEDLTELGIGAGSTFLRVAAALAIGSAWTIPVGVSIGFNPRLARIAQPLAQLAASLPATALFPVIVLALSGNNGGFGLASLLLMLLGTQWYILFNVIAGAMAIPNDLKEAARVCRFRRWEQWRLLILPGIFPYLITGLVTAAGGAWNASIVAEYFHFKGQVLSTRGLGAIISRATDAGNFDQLFAATLVMVISVVSINRLVWHKLYRLAETRFKLET
jgi:NitT/TauT family transport system permease protein